MNNQRIEAILNQLLEQTREQVLPTVYSATMLAGLQELQSLTAGIEAQRAFAQADWKLVPVEPTREMWAAAGDCVTTLQWSGIGHHDKISSAVYRAMLAAAPAAPAAPVAQEPGKLEKLLAEEERSHDQTMRQRDRAEEMATELAEAIGEYFGCDVGEHSSGNCPWENALGVLHAAPQEPAAWVCTARKPGITEQRSLWHGEQGADTWLAHFVGRGCEVTKTPLYAAPPAAEQPDASAQLASIEAMCAMIEAREWADHAGVGEIGKRVEHAISTLRNELQEAQRTAMAEQPGTVKVSRERMERMANDIAYAVYNLADKKLAGLRRGLVETSDPADTALIVERQLRALLAGGAE